MPQDKTSFTTFNAPLEIKRTQERLETILRAMSDARRRLTLTADEALIFLALGQFGLAPSSAGLVLSPVTCSSISDLLNMPKESVRRKASHLLEIGLAVHTTRGIMLKNVDEWRRFAAAFTHDQT